MAHVVCKRQGPDEELGDPVGSEHPIASLDNPHPPTHTQRNTHTTRISLDCALHDLHCTRCVAEAVAFCHLPLTTAHVKHARKNATHNPHSRHFLPIFASHHHTSQRCLTAPVASTLLQYLSLEELQVDPTCFAYMCFSSEASKPNIVLEELLLEGKAVG